MDSSSSVYSDTHALIYPDALQQPRGKPESDTGSSRGRLVAWRSAFVLMCLVLLFVFSSVGIVTSVLLFVGRLSSDVVYRWQSFVVFPGVLSVVLVVLFTTAARKDYAFTRAQPVQRPLHSLTLIVSRVNTIVLAIGVVIECVAGAELRSVSSPAGSSAALEATPATDDDMLALHLNLAACSGGLGVMTLVQVVVELARRPFVLPWITPAEEVTCRLSVLLGRDGDDIFGDDSVSKRGSTGSAYSVSDEKRAALYQLAAAPGPHGPRAMMVESNEKATRRKPCGSESPQRPGANDHERDEEYDERRYGYHHYDDHEHSDGYYEEQGVGGQQHGWSILDTTPPPEPPFPLPMVRGGRDWRSDWRDLASEAGIPTTPTHGRSRSTSRNNSGTFTNGLGMTGTAFTSTSTLTASTAGYIVNRLSTIFEPPSTPPPTLTGDRRSTGSMGSLHRTKRPSPLSSASSSSSSSVFDIWPSPPAARGDRTPPSPSRNISQASVRAVGTTNVRTLPDTGVTLTLSPSQSHSHSPSTSTPSTFFSSSSSPSPTTMVGIAAAALNRATISTRQQQKSLQWLKQQQKQQPQQLRPVTPESSSSPSGSSNSSSSPRARRHSTPGLSPTASRREIVSGLARPAPVASRKSADRIHGLATIPGGFSEVSIRT